MPATSLSSSNEDLDALRDSVRSFLDSKAPISSVREQMATGEYDKATWRQMAEQLGLQGLSLPEEFGGSGFGMAEQLVVFEELGRALYCGPYFSSVALAAGLLLQCDDAGARRDYLEGIASGDLTATAALVDVDESWSNATPATRAHRVGDEWVLNGVKPYVIDANSADLILVPALTDAGLSLFAVQASAPGLVLEPHAAMDATRPQARVTLKSAPARLVGTDGGAKPWLDALAVTATVCLCGEQVGGAKRLLEMSVAYATERHQFGRPIGSFQAIKHKCATLYVETESAGAVARYAAWTIDEGAPDAAVAASMAKSYCSDAFTHAATENIQIHGGVGFTWDNDGHLYLRRAKTSEMFLGDAVYHRGLLADHLEI